MYNYTEKTQLKIDNNHPVILHITFTMGRIVFYLIKSLICLSVHLPVPIIDLVVKEMAPAPEITLVQSNQNKNCTGKVQLQRLFNIESRYEHTSIFMHLLLSVLFISRCPLPKKHQDLKHAKK